MSAGGMPHLTSSIAIGGGAEPICDVVLADQEGKNGAFANDHVNDCRNWPESEHLCLMEGLAKWTCWFHARFPVCPVVMRAAFLTKK